MTFKTLFGAASLAMMATMGAVATAPMALAQTAPASEAPAKAVEIKDMILGNPDAKVEVIEYASYSCPHCRNFHATSFPELKRDYIDTGKIKFVYREVYFDRVGVWASVIARCGGEGRYFGIQDMIYENQDEWLSKISRTDDLPALPVLRKFGLSAGLTNEQLDACLEDRDTFAAMLEKFSKERVEHKVESTPNIVINGVNHGSQSFANLKPLIEAQLNK